MTMKVCCTGMTVWMTGLSASGKTTLSTALQQRLQLRNTLCCLLDGDRVRTGLSADLDFSPKGRHENIRRIAEVAKIVNDIGAIAIVALISPLRSDRALASRIIGGNSFIEVFVDAPMSVCAERDPKGLYQRALSGQLSGFTGVSAPYEPPLAPALHLRTDRAPPDVCLGRIESLLDERLLRPREDLEPVGFDAVDAVRG